MEAKPSRLPTVTKTESSEVQSAASVVAILTGLPIILASKPSPLPTESNEVQSAASVVAISYGHFRCFSAVNIGLFIIMLNKHYLAGKVYILFLSLSGAETLLKDGADPNCVVEEFEVSAMHLAAGLGLESVCLLLQYGGDPNVRSTDGTTPVQVAAIWGDGDVLQLLLANGGDPFKRDQEGLNAVSLARKYNHREVSEILETYILLLNPEEDYTINPKFTYKRLSGGSSLSGRSDSPNLTDATLDISAYDTQQLDDYLSRISKNRRSSVYRSQLQRQVDRFFSDGRRDHLYDVTSPDHPYIEPKYTAEVDNAEESEQSLNISAADSFVTCDGEDLDTVIHQGLPRGRDPSPTADATEHQFLPDLLPERHKFRSNPAPWRTRQVTDCTRQDSSDRDRLNVPNVLPEKYQTRPDPTSQRSEEDRDVDSLANKLKRSSLCEKWEWLGTKRSPSFDCRDHDNQIFSTDSSKTEECGLNWGNDTLISSDESFFNRHPERRMNTRFDAGEISSINVPGENACEDTQLYDYNNQAQENSDAADDEERDTFNTDLWAHVRARKFQQKRNLDTGFCGRNSFCSQLSDASTVEYLYRDTEKGITLIERHIPSQCGSVPSQCGSVGRRSLDSHLSLASDNSADSQATVLYNWQNAAVCVQQEEVVAHSENVKQSNISSELLSLNNDGIRQRLQSLGDDPGPVTSSTRQAYLTRLSQIQQDPDMLLRLTLRAPGYPSELTAALKGTLDLSDMNENESRMVKQFQNPNRDKRWREGTLKSSFNYILLDPRVTKNLPNRACNLGELEVFQTFISAIFYIGKGKRARPYSHLYEAIKQMNSLSNKMSSKIEHILDIWSDDLGVVSLHCFQSTIPVEAYTREACMVDAIGLERLTNKKRGDYYGLATTFSMKERRKMGVHLLKKAQQIFIAEGERQISPLDIKK